MHKYRILPQERLILVQFAGRNKLSDLISSNIAFIEDPLYDKDFDVIFDFRDIMALVYRIDLMEYIEFFKKRIKLDRKVKVALLVNTVNVDFLATIYIGLGPLLGLDVAKFKTSKALYDWMGLSKATRVAVDENFRQLKVEVA